MTPEDRAREALLRCIDKPRYLEAYQPEIARAIREAVEAEREACAQVADERAKQWGARLQADDAHLEVAFNSEREARTIAAAIRARP